MAARVLVRRGRTTSAHYELAPRWAEEGRELVTAVPNYPEGNITVKDRDDTGIRAFREQVLTHVASSKPLVDVRSPEEYRGERLHMPEYPNEGALRGGHVPGAKSIPWARAVNPDAHEAYLKGNYFCSWNC